MRGRNSDWLRLEGGRVVQFGPARTRKGVRVPPRFIVLQPMAAPGTFRKTLCSGAIVGDKLTVEHGALSDALAAAILERFEAWRAPK